MRHGDPRFYALLEEIAELHSRKNHDYAKTDEPLSNFNRSRDLGVEPWRGVLIRMSDKWSRIEQLAGGKVAKNESLRDSLVDLAVYALIDVLLLEDEASRGVAETPATTGAVSPKDMSDEEFRQAEDDAFIRVIAGLGPGSCQRCGGFIGHGHKCPSPTSKTVISGDGIGGVKFVPVGEHGQWIKA